MNKSFLEISMCWELAGRASVYGLLCSKVATEEKVMTETDKRRLKVKAEDEFGRSCGDRKSVV